MTVAIATANGRLLMPVYCDHCRRMIGDAADGLIYWDDVMAELPPILGDDDTPIDTTMAALLTVHKSCGRAFEADMERQHGHAFASAELVELPMRIASALGISPRDMIASYRDHADRRIS